MFINHKILAIWRAASCDKSRLNLNNLHVFCRDGVWIIEATDGHYCARGTFAHVEPDDLAKGFYIPASTAAEIYKVARKARNADQIDVSIKRAPDGMHAEVIGCGQEWRWTEETAAFPDIDQFVPKADRTPNLKAAGVGLSLNILAEIRDTLRDIDRDLHGVAFKIEDDTAPIMVEVAGVIDPFLSLIFVVMPMRV